MPAVTTNTNPNPTSTHSMVTRYRVGTNRPTQRYTLNVSTITLIPKSYSNAFRDPNRWQSRLVANGSTQLAGIDVDETFSPVVKPATVRTVLSLAISRHWPVHQLDVKNAFLHVSLSETVYMHQPPGFQDPRHPDHGSDTAYLLLYVDDIVLTASSTALLQRIIASLHAEFSMTDLGPLNYFLGVSVTRNTSGMFLSQQKYATEVLERAGMLTCNPCRTPVDTDSKLPAAGDPVSDPTLYRSLAGALQYLTFTRPGISYAVEQVCLFMHDPREPHFSALKRILRYVHGTLTSGLQLYSSTTSSLCIVGLSSSNFGLLMCRLVKVVLRSGVFRDKTDTGRVGFISVGYGTQFFSPKGAWRRERHKGKITCSANDVAKDIINVVSFVVDEPVLSSFGGHMGEKVIASGNYNGTQERNVVQRSPSISSTVDLNEVNVPLSTPIVENIDKLERQILDGKLMFVDDDGKPLYKADSMGIANSDSEVEEVSNETTGYMASEVWKKWQ
ncbi:ribonuclease H-like domain-containing protein [Tanacetum coccineum]